jgi:hypothetical protein
MVDGAILVRDGAPVRLDEAEIALTAREQARRLAARAGL